jgi:hypothetical protein
MYGSVPTSPKPAALRKRIRFDQHAERQRKHKSNLKKRKAPKREDFAMAALDTILLLLSYDPKGAYPTKLYQAVLGHLLRAGFDRNECVMRMDRMTDTIDHDLDKRKRKRDWARDIADKAKAAASAGGAL